VYYHCRSLRHVVYDKVFPCNPDRDFLVAYRWLGHYCGFCPQIWLSRSHACFTGARRRPQVKGGPYRGPDRTAGWRTRLKWNNDRVLLGFEHIQGFPVCFDIWATLILNGLMNPAPSEPLGEQQRVAAALADPALSFPNQVLDRRLTAHLDGHVDCAWEDDVGDLPAGDTCGEALRGWKQNRDLGTWLRRFLFVEVDQVVVPSLNLKSAKQIVCINERQKRILRQRGFIEDRIQIRNLAAAKW